MKLDSNNFSQSMKILAIETSCDETAIAVLSAEGESAYGGKSGTNFSILSNQVSSQIKIHRPYGGVVPNLAKREHIKNLPILLKQALREANLLLGSRYGSVSKLDIIAVTRGPGLEPALWTGINFAEKLAQEYKAPLIGVNHLEGHIYSPWVRISNQPAGRAGFQFPISKHVFPLLTLIVSGGHTELVLTEKHMRHKILGETLDDAAGEAFDKVARMLRLPYPGGPEISKLAKKGNPRAINFPRPMINSKDLNFSFSGLKTAVLYKLRDNTEFSRADVSASFEQAVVDVLVKKTLDAARIYKPKTIALGGGVAANDTLRDELSRKLYAVGHTLLLPEKQFTGDNAAMIAVAAYFKMTESDKIFSNPKPLKAVGGLRL